MNQHDARDQMTSSMDANIEEWSAKAISRAAEKIRKYTANGKKSCELDLKYPPRKPDDEISEAVAWLLVEHFEAKGYTVQMVQRANHLGTICVIKWSGSDRLDSIK